MISIYETPLTVFILAVLVYMITGLLWYYKGVFGRKWMKLNHFKDEQIANSGPFALIGSVLNISLTVFSFIIIFQLIGDVSIKQAALLGLLTSISFFVAPLTIIYLFEKRPVGLLLIASSFHMVGFMLTGLIVGSSYISPIEKSFQLFGVSIWYFVLAILLYIIMGLIWYYQGAFGKVWLKLNKFKGEHIINTPKSLLLGVLLNISLLVFSFHMISKFIIPITPLSGATLGFFSGLGFFAAPLATIYMFEKRSPKLFMVNAGFHLLAFVIIGLLFGIAQ